MNKKSPGIFGAILGAVIGSIPMIVIAYLGFFSGWLGLLTAYGAYLGYVKFNGFKSIPFAKKTIMASTICVTAVISIYTGVIYTLAGNKMSNVFATAPILAGFVGYSFIKSKLETYVLGDNPPKQPIPPEFSSSYELNTNVSDITLYLPNPRRLKPFTAYTRLVLLIIMLLFFPVGYLVFKDFASLFVTVPLLCYIICAMIVILKTARIDVYSYAVTSSKKAYKINLELLNAIDTKIFTKTHTTLNSKEYTVIDHKPVQKSYSFMKSKGYTVSKLKKLNPSEIENLKSIIVGAINDLHNQSNEIETELNKCITELKYLNLEKETRNFYVVSYKNEKEITKKTKIAKVYDGLNLFPECRDDEKNLTLDIKSIAISLLCAGVAFLILFFSLGNPFTKINKVQKDNFSSTENQVINSENLVTYECSDFTYQVPQSHIQIEDNAFVSDNNLEIYGIVDVFPLVDDTNPKDFFQSILEEAKENENVVNSFTSEREINGVYCFVGSIVTETDDKDLKLNIIDIIFVPSKNECITVAILTNDSNEHLLNLENSIRFK